MRYDLKTKEIKIDAICLCLFIDTVQCLLALHSGLGREAMKARDVRHEGQERGAPGLLLMYVLRVFKANSLGGETAGDYGELQPCLPRPSQWLGPREKQEPSLALLLEA